MSGSETPILDWINSLKNEKSRHSAKRDFENFLAFWKSEQNSNEPITPGGSELAAQTLLDARFRDLASPDQNMRFTIDNLATKWFNGIVNEGRVTRNTAETVLGNVMGFFRYHRCKILPQVKFLRERTRRKDTPTLKEIQSACSFMDLKYKLAVMVMAQTGARPDSILKLKVADFGPYRDTEFYLLHFMESKRGRNVGYAGFLGPEVGGELANFIRATGLTEKPEERIFNYHPHTLSKEWTKALGSSGLDRTMKNNGRTTHFLYLYTVRTFFKDVLDNTGMSKDWIDLLLGHRLGSSDEAYTPGLGLFKFWREKVYSGLTFASTPLVSESIELKQRLNDMEATLKTVVEALNKILDRGKEMLGLTEDEMKTIRDLKPPVEGNATPPTS